MGYMTRFPSRRGFLPFLRHPGIPLFSVLGIRVVAHYSWFAIAALIVWALTVGWFPRVLPGRPLAHYITLGIITAFFFFASVLVHELMHSVVAVKSGIPVRRITLFLFGGVAEILSEPPDPRTELKVALAGPAASAIIAAGCWTAVVLMGDDATRPGLQLALAYLAVANTVLLGFNLLPGLPLDGGRVLRAILWRTTGNLRRATRIASTAGQAIAGLIVLVGITVALMGGNILTGLWIIMIALFLRQAADTSYRQLLVREALQGVRLTSVMTPDAVTVPPDITLSELIDGYLLRYHFTSYPVVSEGRPIGLITIRSVKRIVRERWGTALVGEAMVPITQGTSLSPDDDIPTALSRMSATGQGRLPVIDASGDLVGIVSRRDIMGYLQIRSDLSSDSAESLKPR
ncbi:MAG: site-2 protease family protein [Candidatus Eisenbacteria sp.]|nr:site-2 protease family protein [Candidatus Eisenbacteria bacterium]